MDLYNKRYRTLAEHRAAVAKRKETERLTAGQDISTLKSKPSKTKAVRSTSTSTNSAATPKPKAKPAAKPASKAKVTKPDGSVKAIKVQRKGSTAVKAAKRPNQTTNGASLGSKLSAAEKAKRAKAAATPNKPARGTARGGSRASNNNRGRTPTSRGPKAGDTRRTRVGSKYVTQMYNGKKWVNGKVGGKG